MKNLIKKAFSLVLLTSMMIYGSISVFGDKHEKHYYDFVIEEDGTFDNGHIMGPSFITIQATVDEEMKYNNYSGRKLATMYGGLVYGTGYEIEFPLINYRAGGSTVGEVEYFKDGAIAIVRVDQVKRKADRLEAINSFKPINSGKDDKSLYLHCNNRDYDFGGVAGCYLQMTDFSDLKRSHVYDNKTVSLDKALEYELLFDSNNYHLDSNKTRFKINKVNWYNLAQGSLFSDVPNEHWAVLEINKCKDLGLISGVSKNRYAPNSTLTKAQVMQVLYNLYHEGEQLDSKIRIKDVANGVWYTKAVKWGVKNKIASLSNGKFHPNSPASREWTCNAFFKAAYKKGSGLPNWLAKSVKKGFSDMKNRSMDSQKAVVALQNAEIISGFSDGLFHPDDTLTRAQMAMILNNYVYAQSQLKDGRYLSEKY